MSRKRMRNVLLLTVLLAAGLYGAWEFGWLPDWPSKPHGFGPRAIGPDELYSNILPSDYVGPDTCGKCHEKQHRLWSAHPHRFMNQLSSSTSIKGDFNDHVWT